jgi:hypothetical protein
MTANRSARLPYAIAGLQIAASEPKTCTFSIRHPPPLSELEPGTRIRIVDANLALDARIIHARVEHRRGRAYCLVERELGVVPTDAAEERVKGEHPAGVVLIPGARAFLGTRRRAECRHRI